MYLSKPSIAKWDGKSANEEDVIFDKVDVGVESRWLLTSIDANSEISLFISDDVLPHIFCSFYKYLNNNYAIKQLVIQIIKKYLFTSRCPFKSAEGLDWLNPYPDHTDVGTLTSDRFGFDWDTIKYKFNYIFKLNCTL